ncbi:hypothetical protein ACLB2K_069460 [Fragaria x ananassa]
MIFERSHFTVSRSFNKILKALNTIAPEFMAKPPPPDITPPNIRESTRFYPFFKDCIGAIDGTHIPTTVVGRESRFTIFKSAPPFPYKIQAELVLACAGLHNFLRQECRSDEFPPEPEDDPVENEEDNFEWDDFQTQEQQRDNANQWRMSIANQMWAEAQANDNNVSNDIEESDHEGEE